MQKKYDYFCTTLSVSPYKNSQLINEIGKKLEEEKKLAEENSEQENISSEIENENSQNENTNSKEGE